MKTVSESDGCRMSASSVAAALSALPPGTPVAVEVLDGVAEGIGYDVIEVQGAMLLVQEPGGVDCISGADCPELRAIDVSGEPPPRPPEAISRAADLQDAFFALRRAEPALDDARYAGSCAGVDALEAVLGAVAAVATAADALEAMLAAETGAAA